MSADPFGAGGIRQRVLASWRASPVRFREDANAEEDLALGGYRNRVIIELAQNAADAAAPGGGRLAFSFVEGASGRQLIAANTGKGLTVAGVQALSTLRASAKAEAAVGRFGVGFAAVLAVTDEPQVVSRTGGVRFSAELTAAAVRAEPELAVELDRRSGHVPILRLPFVAEQAAAQLIPPGYDTAVILPLRDGKSCQAVDQQLAEIGDLLLLALPQLTEILITQQDGASRQIADPRRRWLVSQRSGRWTADEQGRLLANRPTEERSQVRWAVTWARPRPEHCDQSWSAVVHAPTPTDEPLQLPAALLATFPLDPARRHIAPGPLTARLIAEAASGYAELASQWAATYVDALPLVPVGWPAGRLEADLREAILAALRQTPILPPADGEALLRPDEAAWLDLPLTFGEGVLRALAARVPGLTAAVGTAQLRALEVAPVELADVIAQWPTDGRSPAQWRELYETLAPLADEPSAREALAGLPVPLIDDRTVRGPRSALLAGELPLSALLPWAAWGLRVVDPQAAHDLLVRLGARLATAESVLSDPCVRAALTDPDRADDADRAAAILSLADRAAPNWLPPPWLGEVRLPAEGGGLRPARLLVLAGSPAAEVLDPERRAILAAEVASHWSVSTLPRVGVITQTAAITLFDIDLHDPPDQPAIDEFRQWSQAAAQAGLEVLDEAPLVPHLASIRAECWPRVLATLATGVGSRLRRPVRDRGRTFTPYLTWWLARHGIEAQSGPSDVVPSATEELLAWLADQERDLTLGQCLRAWRQLALVEDSTLPLPATVRAWSGSGTVVVDPADCVVIDQPQWLQRCDLGAFVIAPPGAAAQLADVLDLDLATDRAGGLIESPGILAPLPPAALLPPGPATWWEHDSLTVDGQPVDWWVEPVSPGDPQIHATTMDGLARAVAWAAGSWGARHRLAAALTDPAELELGRAFESD